MTPPDAHPVGSHRVVIVAFDGILADTIPQRASVLADAIALECASVGMSVTAAHVLPLLHATMPGRTFGEALSVAIAQLPVLHDARFRDDGTVHELVTLRAQRGWSTIAAHGVALCDGALGHVQRVLDQGRRVVVRSDAPRRDVEPTLQLAGLEDRVMVLRCADDMPRRSGVSMLQDGYEAIHARLDPRRFPRTHREAIEFDDHTAALALGFVATSRTAW